VVLVVGEEDTEVVTVDIVDADKDTDGNDVNVSANEIVVFVEGVIDAEEEKVI
jgi:hypothetical protein